MKVTALVLGVAITHAVCLLGDAIAEGVTQASGRVTQASGDERRFVIIQVNHLKKKAGNSNAVAHA